MSDRRPDARFAAAADIVFAATVRADRLRFEAAPRTAVAYLGEQESYDGGRRVGLPDRVAEGEVYREIRVDYVIASTARPGT
ncbi:hypothetical protein [Nonomuraea sp. NPDC048916]|uniref:hypothetical protein n=1 Tax=Nonomuraea sp. NPDC048916 TaxID=3154232 RepID=UPI0033CDAC5F